MSTTTTARMGALRFRVGRPAWGTLLIHAVLIAGAFAMVIPFLWMLTLSLKSVALTHQAPYLIPTHFEFAI